MVGFMGIGEDFHKWEYKGNNKEGFYWPIKGLYINMGTVSLSPCPCPLVPLVLYFFSYFTYNEQQHRYGKPQYKINW